MHMRTAAKSIACAAIFAVSVISIGRTALDAQTAHTAPESARAVQDIPGEQVSLFSAPR